MENSIPTRGRNEGSALDARKVYEKSGKYQMIIEHITDGLCDLYQAYEQLKKKLTVKKACLLDRRNQSQYFQKKSAL